MSYGDMADQVDAGDLKSPDFGRVGSTPSISTTSFKLMTLEEIEIRLNELESEVLKNPTADFQELTRIIFEMIKELRQLRDNKNE